jgi:hypothetical protein
MTCRVSEANMILLERDKILRLWMRLLLVPEACCYSMCWGAAAFLLATFDVRDGRGLGSA